MKPKSQDFSQLFYLNPFPNWIYESENLKILEVNQAALSLYGYTREEFLKLKMNDLLVREESPTKISSHTSIGTQSGKKFIGIFEHKKKNRKKILVELNAHQLDFQSLKCTLVICLDITERENKLQELIDSEEKLRAATEIANIGYWKFILKTNELNWTKEVYQIWGLEDKSFDLNYQNLLNSVHPDDRNAVERIHQSAFENRKATDIEYRISSGVNSVKWIREQGRPVIDLRGNILAIEGTVQDITINKQEEHRLKLMESVITNTSDAILITEAEPFDEPGNRIVFVNEAFTKMTGYSSEEVIGRSPRILQGPDSDQKEISRLGKALRNWESCESTLLNYKKNGEEFWLKMTISPVANEKGWYTHWIAIERDVTEQKNKEIEQALLSQVRLIFNEEKSLVTASQKLCAAFAELGKFDFVEFWLPNLENSQIRLISYWDNPSLKAHFTKEFRQINIFQFGEGLPGKVLKTGKSFLWDHKSDQSSFLRKKTIIRAKIVSVLAIPLTFKRKPVGVLVFGSKSESEKLNRTLRIFGHLDSFIASEINRKYLETNLSHLIEALPDIICISDFQGRFLKINKAGCEMLGYREDEILYRNFDAFVHPEDRNIFKTSQTQVQEGETVVKFENRFLTKNKDIVWLGWTCNFSEEDGIIYSTAKNITSEKKLRELNAQASTLARIGSWEIDLVNEQLFWTEMVHSLHETDPQSYVPYLEEAIDFYRDDYKEVIKSKINQCITNKEPFNFEAVILTSKNKERWVRVIGNGEYLEDKCIRIYGSFQDIHDQKEAENRLQSLADNLPGVVFQYLIYPDGTDRLKYVSKGSLEIWGISSDVVMKNNQVVWDQIKAGGDFETVNSSIRDSLISKTKWTARWRYVMPNGEIKIHSGIGTPTYWADGTVIFNSLVLDITEEKKTEELLRQASEMARIGSWELDLINQHNDSMYWSPMTKEIFGIYDSYDPTFSRGLEYLTPESKERANAAAKNLISTRESFDIDLQMVTADGQNRWVRCIGKSERIKGKCVKIYGSIQDIHSAKSLELQIIEILESISDAFFAVDNHWNITYFNREARNLFQCPKSELLGKNIWREFSGKMGTTLEKIFREVSSSGKQHSFEYLFPGDGKWYEINTYPSNGGVSSYFKNIDDRRKAAVRLEQAYLEKTNIIESIADAFFTMDRNFIVSSWNRAAEQLIGIKREHLIGKNYWEVFPEALKLPSFHFYNQVLETGQAITFEEKNGKWLEVNAYPSEEGLTVFFRDISLRKESDSRILSAYLERNQILERIGDAFFAMDKDWNVTYWNKRAEEIIGVKREEIIGFNLWEKFPQAKELEFFTQYELSFKNQQPVSFVEYYPPLNQWYETNGYPSPDGISVFFRDVTVKKTADELIIKANERFEKAAEATNDAIWDWDIENQTFFRSRGFEKFFGRNAQKELLEEKFWKECFYPEDLTKLQKSVKEALANPNTFRWEMEYRILKENGKIGYVVDRGIIVRNECGEATRMVGTMTDVSNLIEAQQQILSAKERFEKVSKATNDAIWDWNIKDNTVYWGDGFKTLFGIDVEKVDPSLETWTSFVHPEDLQKVYESLMAVVKDPKAQNWLMEYRHQRADQSYAFVINRGVTIRDSDGKAVQMVGAMTDISSRKRQEEELLALNESLKKHAHALEITNDQLEQFAHIASHDLQEPLRMITSFLDQLKRKYGHQLDEKAHQYIHFSTDGAKRMKQIILDLLDYSRAGKFQEKPVKISLNNLVSDFKSLRKKIIAEKSAVIIHSDLPDVIGYKAPITQVIHCLLDNAIKYSKKSIPPHIELKIEENEMEWVFSVRDNGLGINPQYFEKIFVIFQRLHNRDEYSGTGIGLSIVKKQVESWGGKVWLESNMDQGTVFYFTLPKA